MTIQEAYELTKTKNANQLASFLGISHTAVYKWEGAEKLPESGEIRVAKAVGLWPDTNKKAS